MVSFVCSYSLMMTSSNAPPSARAFPFIASVGNLVYLWGGQGDTEPEAIFLFHHDTETWVKQRTRGPHPPAGLRDGGCCISNQHLYIYGGEDENVLHGVLYELNTDSWTWTKLYDDSHRKLSDCGPGKKSGCRMISYQNQLLVVGGNYFMYPNSCRAVHYEDEYTDEVHCYNLTTGKCVHRLVN